MSLSLLDQPTDIQIEILRKLPIESLLQICQSSRQFQELCHDANKLDEYFKKLTIETFGIKHKLPNKLTDSWYATFLTLYNDLMKITTQLINLYTIDKVLPKYIIINRDLLRSDISILISNLFKDIMNENKYLQDDGRYDDDEDQDEDQDEDEDENENQDEDEDEDEDKEIFYEEVLYRNLDRKYEFRIYDLDGELSFLESRNSKRNPNLSKIEITRGIIHQFINKYLPRRS